MIKDRIATLKDIVAYLQGETPTHRELSVLNSLTQLILQLEQIAQAECLPSASHIVEKSKQHGDLYFDRLNLDDSINLEWKRCADHFLLGANWVVDQFEMHNPTTKTDSEISDRERVLIELVKSRVQLMQRIVAVEETEDALSRFDLEWLREAESLNLDGIELKSTAVRTPDIRSEASVEYYPCPKTLDDLAAEEFGGNSKFNEREAFKVGYREGHKHGQLRVAKSEVEPNTQDADTCKLREDIVKYIEDTSEILHAFRETSPSYVADLQKRGYELCTLLDQEKNDQIIEVPVTNTQCFRFCTSESVECLCKQNEVLKAAEDVLSKHRNTFSKLALSERDDRIRELENEHINLRKRNGELENYHLNQLKRIRELEGELDMQKESSLVAYSKLDDANIRLSAKVQELQAEVKDLLNQGKVKK